MKLLIRCLYILSHPLMILPIVVAIIWRFGSYTPQQITELQQVPLFLQGSNDWGSSNIFSATMALYVVFGVLGAIYLMLALQKTPVSPSLFEDILVAIRIMRFHLWCFLLGSILSFAENDFRNMYLFIAMLYSATLISIVVMNRFRLSLPLKLLLAQSFMIAWLIVGSDGNTAKAGQIVQSWQEPLPIARSARHAIMLGWHAFVNRIFGEITPDTEMIWRCGIMTFFFTLIVLGIFSQVVTLVRRFTNTRQTSG